MAANLSRGVRGGGVFARAGPPEGFVQLIGLFRVLSTFCNNSQLPVR